MIRISASVCLLAGAALALTACATPATTSAVDWNRPMTPATSPPVLLHDMAIANPPYPQAAYLDYMDEPTRFEFHPRNLIVDQQDDGTGDDGAADDTSGGVLDNGILYVDPNQ